MGRSHLGPAILYLTFVGRLSGLFVVFPVLLLSGRKDDENTWRWAGLMSQCASVLVDLAWVNLHPQPLSLHALAAAASSIACN